MSDAAPTKGFQARVLTLFPEMFPGSLGLSLAGRALNTGLWSLQATDIRDFAEDKHRSVDDTPSGGGAGMVMRADVVAKAVDAVHTGGEPLIYLSPRGKPLTQERIRELASGEGVTLLCGRFEGLDQRVIEARVMEEISLGDFILSGGEPAALALLDAIIRLLPGVMGKELSGEDESFEGGLLEYPHYTRPQVFEGREIPAVLTSGDHGRIKAWRRAVAEEATKSRRSDLWEKFLRFRSKDSRKSD
ncbi:MAG: tRNA (guanosine(37)-N1)-methyltransferase TrmD [Parvibaculaceae bacterium]